MKESSPWYQSTLSHNLWTVLPNLETAPLFTVDEVMPQMMSVWGKPA